jgi:CDP-6-deoxy-D-xylo-4-hexulose-3-dehydrase
MTSTNLKIRLVNDTINKEDIDRLTSWLQTYPQLTKGPQTKEFEKAWSAWQGRKYSVFVNSGSSANLAMIYALMLTNRLKNKKIIVPAVSWVTTVAPIIQLGLDPIMCDADKETMGVDVKHLKNLFERDNPSALIIVHVLGFPNKMKEILELCEQYNVILLEDSCESMGSTYDGIKTGNFGIMSSFSTYFGHHFSTIEGGIVNTDDEELYNILLSIRSHGWDRDLPEYKRKELREVENVSEFRALYTFYYPGFNLRSTDLQAYIGLGQLEKLDDIVIKRNANYKTYHKLIKNNYWKIEEFDNVFVSNFAYPIITPKLPELVYALMEGGVEIRPLVCGSIGEQPFWKNAGLKADAPWAKVVHEQGLYLPNNPQITTDEISFICDIVNKNVNF